MDSYSHYSTQTKEKQRYEGGTGGEGPHTWCHASDCTAIHQSTLNPISIHQSTLNPPSSNQPSRSPRRPIYPRGTRRLEAPLEWGSTTQATMGESSLEWSSTTKPTRGEFPLEWGSTTQPTRGESPLEWGSTTQPTRGDTPVSLYNENTRAYHLGSTDYNPGHYPEESENEPRVNLDDLYLSMDGSCSSSRTGISRVQDYQSVPEDYTRATDTHELQHDYQNVNDYKASKPSYILKSSQSLDYPSYSSQHFHPLRNPKHSKQHHMPQQQQQQQQQPQQHHLQQEQFHRHQEQQYQCRLHSTPTRIRRNRGGSVSSSSDYSYMEMDRFSGISGIDGISLVSGTSTLDRSTLSSGARSTDSTLDRSTHSSGPRSTDSTLDRTSDWSYSDRLISTPLSSSHRVNSSGCLYSASVKQRASKYKSNGAKSQPSSPGETRKAERTAGCCTLGGEEPMYSTLDAYSKPPAVSSCVKSFMSWMVSKAGQGTAAILDNLPNLSKEDFHIVMIGLDGAGKTTALYRLKFDQYINTVPTIGFNCERIRGTLGKCKGLTFLIWDVGGQEKIRPLWRSYTRCTDGIIFVVDSANHDLFEEAKVELYRTMRYQNNSTIPVLVMANKQDLPTAASTKQIEESLGLRDLNTSLWQIEPACSITGEGLDTGLEALHQLILNKKKMAKRNRNKTK